MKNIIKVVITGGPCGGKTKAINWIKDKFSENGIGVLVVAETATELLNSGISPTTCGSVKMFQKYILEMQLGRENVYQKAAESLPQENIVIIYDRGAMDGKAYLTDEEFIEVAEWNDTSEEELLKRYDAVFHLESVAKGQRDHYSNRSNGVRMETVEEAARVDDRIIEVWCSHPHFHIIKTTPMLDEKLEVLEAEIKTFLEARGC